MKRFIVTLILTIAIAGVLTYSMPKRFDSYVNDIDPTATVSIYCRNTSMDSIDMGTGRVVQCCASELRYALARCKDVDGFSVRFGGSEQDIYRIVRLFDLSISSTLDLDGLLIVCGNSAKITGGVMLEGDKVNLQIAYKEGTVTVGSPLILGDY